MTKLLPMNCSSFFVNCDFSKELPFSDDGLPVRKTKKRPYILESMHPEWNERTVKTKRNNRNKSKAPKNISMDDCNSSDNIDCYWDEIGEGFKIKKNKKRK